MAILLPSIFALQLPGGKFLSLTESIPAGANHLPSEGLLKFEEEDLRSPRARFAAEPAAVAEAGDGHRLYHIRSLYNNKYLVVKQIDDDNSSSSWIVASAKKQEDDVAKGSSCTLFELYNSSLPEEDDDQTNISVYLRHVGTGMSAADYNTSSNPDEDDKQHQGMLRTLNTNATRSLIVADISEPMLPELVTFRSQHLDGSYLRAVMGLGFPAYHIGQMFVPGLDLSHLVVSKKLVPRGDGRYVIKDNDNGEFWVWYNVQNLITVQPDESRAQEFTFVHIENNLYGLRHMNTGWLGYSHSSFGSTNVLGLTDRLVPEGRLIVGEPVIKRVIKGVDYRLSDSIITDETVEEVDYLIGTNDSEDHEDIMTFDFSRTDSRTISWNNNVSVNLGVKVEFKVNFVPFVAGTSVELSMNVGYEHEWGGSETRQTTRTSTYTTTVPPKTTVKVTMLAARGKCQVPFDYIQRDLLPSGEWVESRKDGGVFNGINSFDIRFRKEVVESAAT